MAPKRTLVAIEDQGIRAYIPIPDMDHRTEFFSRRPSPMTPSVMCTSVRQAKNCTLSLLAFDRAITALSGLCQGLQSLPAQSPVYHQ